MTSFSIEDRPFDKASVALIRGLDRRYSDWPVVYTLNDDRDIYVGESLNFVQRMHQHLDSKSKRHLRRLRVVLDDEFNKSASLDLESYLIRLLAGDGQFQVLNGNAGITDAAYYRRDVYRETFAEIFDALRSEGVFTRSIHQIENDDLFKLSPFKALTSDQAIAVEDILEGLFADLENRVTSTIVVQGDPGTGKTILGVYLIKLLMDIAATDLDEPADTDSMFGEYFVPETIELLSNLRIALVVPQQSLRTSVKSVFGKTTRLAKNMVLSPFEVGARPERFDLLIVDETQRLTQRANQSAGPLNKKFREINERLFGNDDLELTQLDWMVAQSDHQIFLLDSDQAVRPADLPRRITVALAEDARTRHRHYPLVSQMRVRAGDDFVGYVRGILGDDPPPPRDFEPYEFRMFDDIRALDAAIHKRDADFGLARMVAGYAWRWKSKKHPDAFDIDIDGHSLRWNQADRDWISSPGSVDEVGSIHTVQGYDLNYAGVIIGPDLRFDVSTRRVVADLDHYFDAKGKENNRARGIVYTPADIEKFIKNIYAVLLTRGMLGTYVYVVDPALRDHLRDYVQG